MVGDYSYRKHQPTKGGEMNTDATMPATRDEEAEIMGLMTERNIAAQDGGQA